MKTYVDCLPCFCRQAYEAVRFATEDVEIQAQIIKAVLKDASEYDMTKSPPEMAADIHRRVKELTGVEDPYRAVKEASTQFALQMYPMLRERVLHSGNPLETAVRLAAAGNVIDFGVSGEMDCEHYQQVIERALHEPLQGGGMDTFESDIQNADLILYLADNAGEIVFDRLLLEQLPLEKTILAVRGEPIINDATMEDAKHSELPAEVRLIDNGSAVPGTLLSSCSPEFQDIFQKADMVISKGQANYETLSTVDAVVYYILKVKCPVIGRDIGLPQGSFVIKRSARQ